jgi:hypothetical protein
MRYLKRKIQRAQTARILSPLTLGSASSSQESDHMPEILPKVQKRIKKSEPPSTFKSLSLSKASYNVKSTKNIVKNYGRAITNFILSPLARIYLEEYIKKDFKKVDQTKFLQYISERRGTLDCMERLKRFLIVTDNDTSEEVSYKEIFKKIAEIFIKYFSVNWIFSSKLTYKQAHLDFRFKLLRRLRNPELFTYMTSFQKKI